MDQLHILRPMGIVNAQNGADLLSQIGDVLACQSVDFLIDLEDVDFMDSSGFGSLVCALKRVREHHKQIYLSGLNSQLKLVLELTSMDQVFKVFTCQQDCIDFLAGKEAESGGPDI
jgi:anti-anti-sigma factor